MQSRAAKAIFLSVVLIAGLAAASALLLRKSKREPVPVVASEQVLAMIRAGKKVVFVDAREPAEFAEEHIPGAINVSLREVADLDPEVLGDPDLVIAYCLKDFRGYEVAKALRRADQLPAGILADLGINGWKSRGLPTFIRDKISAEEASLRLARCAGAPAECLTARR